MKIQKIIPNENLFLFIAYIYFKKYSKYHQAAKNMYEKKVLRQSITDRKTTQNS